MARKYFDKSLYEKNDQKARQWVRDILPFGLVAKDNPNIRGVDLFIYKDNQHIFNIEPEVKMCWVGKFPYDTLNLPVRKSKMAYLEKPTLFIVFRSDGEEYFCIWDNALVSSEIKEVKNKFVKSGELFFSVELEYCDRDIRRAMKRKAARRKS